MDVEVHVQSGIPPSAEKAGQKSGVWNMRTFSGFEVFDEEGLGLHGCGAEIAALNG